jgi:hypothetical protein
MPESVIRKRLRSDVRAEQGAADASPRMVRFRLCMTYSFKMDDERKAIVMPVAASLPQPSRSLALVE